MAFSWNRFRRRRRRRQLIEPIKGRPFNNIPRWLYEKTTKTRDPIEGKTRKTKEKKINIPNLQKTLLTLRNKINEMVNWVSRIPEVEQRMDELEQEYRRDIAELRAKVDSMSRRNSTTDTYEEGGVIQVGDIVKDMDST